MSVCKGCDREHLLFLATAAEGHLRASVDAVQALLDIAHAMPRPVEGDARVAPDVLDRVLGVTLLARLCDDMMHTYLRGAGAVAHEAGGKVKGDREAHEADAVQVAVIYPKHPREIPNNAYARFSRVPTVGEHVSLDLNVWEVVDVCHYPRVDAQAHPVLASITIKRT